MLYFLLCQFHASHNFLNLAENREEEYSPPGRKASAQKAGEPLGSAAVTGPVMRHAA
jgi:hypothetical protein